MADTKTLRTTIQGKIIQLDYDWISSLDGSCLYCLTDGQVQMILGIVDYFGWTTRWYAESGEISQAAILELQGNLIGALMNGCCGDDNPPVQVKYVGLDMYRSTDGGVTFNLSPTYDYRNTSTRWPKPSELGIVSTKCEAADSVGMVFKVLIQEQVTDDMGAVAILGAIAAALIFFLSSGTTVAISAQIQALVAAILGVGVAAWQAAFTEEVWDIFRCLIYENMDSDETISQAGLDAVYSALDTELTGIAVPTLKGYIAAAGLVGINNMMAQLSGEDDADCDSCNEFCGSTWIVVDDREDLPEYDSEEKTISGDATFIVANYYWAIKVPYPECCNMAVVLTGAGSFAKFYAPCDYEGELTLDEGTGWVLQGLDLNGNYRGVLIRSSSPFSAVATFA